MFEPLSSSLLLLLRGICKQFWQRRQELFFDVLADLMLEPMMFDVVKDVVQEVQAMQPSSTEPRVTTTLIKSPSILAQADQVFGERN